jgi:hypothetical protein
MALSGMSALARRGKASDYRSTDTITETTA